MIGKKMNKKAVFLLGMLIFSMFLFVYPIKAEKEIVEISPVADVFTEERGFGIQVRDYNYLMTYYWIGGDELRETYIKFNLPNIDNLNSIILKLTEVGYVNNNITDFPIKVNLVSNNWSEEDVIWDSKPEEIGMSTIVYLTKDTSDGYYRDYFFDLSDLIGNIKEANNPLITFYLSPNNLTVDNAYIDAKSSEYTDNITCRPKLILGYEGSPSLFTLDSNAGTPDIDGIFMLYWTASQYANNYSLYQNDTLIESGLIGNSYLIENSINGSYTFKVIAFNDIGNITSNEITVNIEIPLIPPEPELIKVEPLVINGNLGWESLADSQSWCYGLGIKYAPYIIENIEIEHTDYDYFTRGLEPCLEIDNSNVYFIIKDCIFHGAGRLPIQKEDGSWIIGYGGNGIMIRNVSNGLIINNICYDNVQNNGIEILDYSNNIIVKNNTCFGNGDCGVYIGAYCENNIIIENNIGSNGDRGIGISRSDNNQIINNSMIGEYGTNFGDGLYLVNSDHNLISGNLIDAGMTGIELETSDYNNITDNIVYYYQYDIVEVGSSGIYCKGNIIENNTLIFKDFLPPYIYIYNPKENDVFNKTAPSFHVYIVERLITGIDTQWYTINNGTTNYNFTLTNYHTGNDSYGEYIAAEGFGTIDQEAWNKCGNGSIVIRFYAKDNLGYIDYKEIVIIKDIESLPPITDVYIIIIGAIGIIVVVGVAIILIRKRITFNF
jgi:parallel beta-helix repeat protein